MSGIIEYLQWRGDLAFDSAPFCPVDALVLSQLSYLHWELASRSGPGVSLRDMWEDLGRKPISTGSSVEDDLRLLQLVCSSKRYGGAELVRFVDEIAQEEEKQFSASTFLLPDGTIFVALRGTDGTLVGWKEDFNLAFSTPVPSQIRALSVLREAATGTHCPIRIGGHSKGGNLAVYAAVMAEQSIQDRLLGVYNFDGPGLSDTIDSGALYARIAPRLYSYMPQASLVGILLSYYSNYTVVECDSFGISQHNPHNWHVLGDRFVTVEERSRNSLYVEKVLRKWLTGLNEEERRIFVDALFALFAAAKSDSFGKDFWTGLVRNPVAVASVVQSFEPNVRSRLMRMFSELASAALHAGDDAPDLPSGKPQSPA